MKFKNKDFPEFKMERTVFRAVDKPFGWWGRFINRVLKWLYMHWDDSIVYFDVDEKKLKKILISDLFMV